MSYHVLKQKLESLEARRRELQDQECLVGVRLERFAPGTAPQKAKQAPKYARLRSGKGKTLGNGKKSQYIALESIPEAEAAIARGRELVKVERSIKRLTAQLDAIALKAAALGLSLPQV